MMGGILFLVIEKEIDYEGNENMAQLFLELLCKTKFPFLGYAELVYSSSRNELGQICHT